MPVLSNYLSTSVCHFVAVLVASAPVVPVTGLMVSFFICTQSLPDHTWLLVKSQEPEDVMDITKLYDMFCSILHFD